MRLLCTIIAAIAVALFASPAFARAYSYPVGDIISRVQTNLNRVAHGLPPIESKDATTDADRLVDVLAGLLGAETRNRARAQLNEIEDHLLQRLNTRAESEAKAYTQFSKYYPEQRQKIEKEFASPTNDDTWRRFVAVAYLALLSEADGNWSPWRQDLRGAIRLPCVLAPDIGGTLEFETSWLRERLGPLTTCPTSDWPFGGKPKVTEADLGPLVEARRAWFERRRAPRAPETVTSGFPTREVADYRKAVRHVEGDWSRGSTGRMIYGSLEERESALAEVPQGELDDPGDRALYQTWQYMTLSNHHRIAIVDQLADVLRTRLIAYYVAKRVSPETARRAAIYGLDAITLGGDCGDNIVPQSFRVMLLERAPLAEIEAFAASNAWRNAETLMPLAACSVYADKDPLAHIAIIDLDAFIFLRSLSATLTPQEKVDLDLVLDVDARNVFWKTPLMTAAQFDRLDAVQWLLKNGADVNAATDVDSLQHGRRTPLIYAAASGSLSVIEALIDAGADPNRADTTGLSAVDYLVGRGFEDEPANPNLSADDILAAYRLLR